jgi:hypothetical protein
MSSNILSIRGLCVDQVDKIVESPEYIRDPVIGNMGTRTVEICGSALIKWEQECSVLASSVHNCSDEIPVAHVETLGGEYKASSSPEKIIEKLKLWRHFQSLTTQEQSVWMLSLSAEAKKLLLYEFVPDFSFTCYGRQYFSTKMGRLGLGSLGIREGDRIYIFYGAEVPFIVRFGASDNVQLVGHAYVNGIMNGESLTVGNCGDDEEIRIA